MSHVIEINNLVKRYNDLLALDHFNLTVEEGEILGLLGPNGSGKTTTINCILSLLTYDKGSIKVFGQEMKPNSYDLKKDIGVVMQDVAVFDELTVYENIDYFCGLYIKDKSLRKQYVEETIDFVELSDFRKFKPKKLSGGLLRRLNIACGIAHKPKLIFFDEPTVAVDPQSRNKILDGIKDLNKKGATIIYTSHYMEEIEQLCSRIIIMDKGKSIAAGTKEELKAMIHKTEKIQIEVFDLETNLLEEIKSLKYFENATYKNNVLNVSFKGGRNNLAHVMNVLSDHSGHLGRIYSEHPTLNDVFLEITGTELRDYA
ncbi:ABC transporter ATP-binding protein [Lachnobacterium bovis]|uniref:ABC-2 type transport system ATP-binding protein n=1 Tax=Lachnobacterium bovis TaxID=140626 RepID=A0A1H9TAG4_9FIRM|nr:ABC transporter ATP-binding protein [Lachnobacterium bovis]SER94116.1 ABC-2 type transport system ATP-binding protein [Lachnobacterium bovis]